jgi:trimeric autotransporter adhesin
MLGSGTIGGTVPAERNAISGNSGAGIRIQGDDSVVYNNIIGPAAFADVDLGNRVAIEISGGATGNVIGGIADGEGNRIAGSSEQGVVMSGDATLSNPVAGNDIRRSGGPAIDLGDDGPTRNDDGDADSGPNRLQNFPELAGARFNGQFLRIDGTLTSQPGDYRLDFYISAEQGFAGYGEGSYVGSAPVVLLEGTTTERFGASIDVGFEASSEFFVSVVAVRNDTGDTSEFSRPILAALGGNSIVVTNTNDAGAGSLRAAIAAANANADPSTITFNIPGAAPHVISPVAFLGVSGGPVVIDGYMQMGSSLNTLSVGTNAVPGIILDGTNEASAAVLNIAAPTLIRGFAIVNGQSAGIRFLNVDDSRIEGCFVGVGADGSSDQGNTGAGITTTESTGVTIGGPARGQRNLISYNGLRGIGDTASSTRIYNNLIGATEGNATSGNSLDGILGSGLSTIIGGDEPEFGNTISGNQNAGVRIDSDIGVQVHGNSIAANGTLGIDLSPVGVTPNDADDADAGANNLQNFPVITEASVQGDSLTVTAVLDVPDDKIGDVYSIRAFASEVCDGSGHGEGARMLGVSEVEIPPGETLELTIVADVAPGEFLTLTATDPAFRATSEFSLCFAVSDGNLVCGDYNGDGEVKAGDALSVLQTGVGTLECELCVCDVNDSGSVTAPDALLVLRVAVGQDVVLDCPGCG